MIKALYETHLQVKNLDESIKFYETLGLELLSRSGNRVAFMMIGAKGNHQELGLWQIKEGEEVSLRHFAFEVEFKDLLNAKSWLKEKEIETIGVFGLSNDEPVVHVSGPLASIYFNDPDGNQLEFASRISGKPRNLHFVPTLSEWEAINKN